MEATVVGLWDIAPLNAENVPGEVAGTGRAGSQYLRGDQEPR